MRLFFLRHGPAVSQEGWSRPDEERPLTDEGREVVAAVGERLSQLDVHVDAILTSPFVRASQTAEIVADALGARDALAVEPRLASGFAFRQLREILADTAQAASVVLVGHNPDLTDVVRQLVGGGSIKLRKTAIALVDLKDLPSGGTLVWLAQPDLMVPCPPRDADRP